MGRLRRRENKAAKLRFVFCAYKTSKPSILRLSYHTDAEHVSIFLKLRFKFLVSLGRHQRGNYFNSSRNNCKLSFPRTQCRTASSGIESKASMLWFGSLSFTNWDFVFLVSLHQYCNVAWSGCTMFCILFSPRKSLQRNNPLRVIKFEVFHASGIGVGVR